MAADLASAFQPAVIALGWTLLHAAWQGALIVAAYAVLRMVFHAPRARVALGHGALLALVAVPCATFMQRLSVADPTGAAVAEPLVVNALAAADADGIALEAWLPWLVLGWSGGVLLLCVRQVLQWRELHRLCRRAEALDADWLDRFAALQARVGVRFNVGLRQSAEVALPMLVGLLRPTILLPAGLVLRLPADRVELILLHELAHLRRLDPLFNLLQTVVDTLLFFHPAVHWMSRRLREDRELCCDQIVLANGADPLRYARVLLALAESHAAPPAPLALAATGGALMQRIERIVDVPSAARTTPRALGPAGVMLGVALLGIFLLQDRARWVALEPLPFGFGHARLALPSLGAPQVFDLAPRLEPSLAPPLEPEATVEPSLSAPAPEAAPRLAIAPADSAPPASPSAPSTLALAPTPTVAVPAPAPAEAPPAPAIEAEPEPRQRIAPVYPADARARGVEGHVMLTYRIDVDGRAFDVGIDAAQPEGEFERAARAALAQWRFDPAQASMTEHKVRFDFRLDAGADPANATRAKPEALQCLRNTGTRLCRPMREAGLRTAVLSAG